MLSEHKGHHCQHRSDDFADIAAIIAPHKPQTVVELGSDEGGFSAWLADLVAPWGGVVYTFDIADKLKLGLTHDFPNLRFALADVLRAIHPTVAGLVSRPSVLLYCDNGNKQREVELYAPLLQAGSLLGVHDYGTEIKAEWVEPHVAALGYTPDGHERMEALRNEWYPEPLTRLWLRKAVLTPPAAKPAPESAKSPKPTPAQAAAPKAPATAATKRRPKR